MAALALDLRQNREVVPGFHAALGYTLFWLGVIVIMPLIVLFGRAFEEGLRPILDVALSDRAIAAYRLSFGAAALAAAINTVLGLLVAWVLVRYRFPGRALLDALVDLPIALPTAVAGIALTQLYAPNGIIGEWLKPLGVQVAFTPTGVVLALTFIGLPFVVRTVQPVLADLGMLVEEAAATLGASRWLTFRKVILPAVRPALLTGAALAFARGVGEYGSVIFIAGNMPFKSEIAPLLIVIQLEQYDYAGAAAIAVVMLLLSFSILLGINIYQGWERRRYRQVARA
ncbi:MAG TPA: sulfate ABC transporter permease subunit CysT [Xanthomonadales bacterium]|nr:sulfate ABC transporter permease subunit CysT [Xanthomonadales bacterium]